MNSVLTWTILSLPMRQNTIYGALIYDKFINFQVHDTHLAEELVKYIYMM